MTMDGVVIRALVHELQECIGGRIHKIHQPNKVDLILNVRVQKQNKKLLLSANATYPRVYLSQAAFSAPTEAPMFCMLLRKYCEGGKIEAIQQVGMERVIHIDIRQRNELGDVGLKRIIIELMGRHSNIILIDPQSENILDGIHHVTPSISSYRIVLPGHTYVTPPQQNKLHPLDVTADVFYDLFTKTSLNPAAWLVATFSGFSPLLAGEIVLRVARTHYSDHSFHIDTFWCCFQSVMRLVMEQQYTPMTGINEHGKLIFYAISLQYIQSDETTYQSMSACVEQYYGEKAERDMIKQKATDLFRFLHSERNKNEKKITLLHRDLKQAEDADRFRLFGQLLLASLHLIAKGQRQITVQNFFDECQNDVTIVLNTQLSPADNAQQYFKKYTKYKTSIRYIQEQLSQTEQEMLYFDTILNQLSFSAITDIEEIREELIEQGYLRARPQKKSKQKKISKPQASRYTSSEGIEIVVGKNNIQNEYVTHRIAAKDDTWLHTKHIPGAHVVIRNHTYGIPTLEEAAQLAAHFSQARSSSNVPVDYTQVCYVRKPKGAKPGFVIYDHEKTRFVTPNDKCIQKLLSTLKKT